MAQKTAEELLEGRDIRRGKQESRFLDKLDRQMNEAEPMIGELCREGKTIFYINVRSKTGRMTGAIKEFGTRADAYSYLIRNHYV